MAGLTITSTLPLNNGVTIPRFGLGVWRSRPGEETAHAVQHALKSGYRHIDTAHFYKNEKDVGEAVRRSGIPREQIFVTTKLWNDDHGYDRALRACDDSLNKLGFSNVDLYLVHFPVREKRKDSWRALETLCRDGKCRAIGVSNYTIRHLEELLSHANVVPAVNQVEFHPWLYQKDLVEFCRQHGILVEAYSPLTKGQKVNDPELMTLAKRYRRSGAQILIRWALQHDLIVIPKSIHPERIDENANVFDFEITPDDMKTLDGFHTGLRVAWDPNKEP